MVRHLSVLVCSMYVKDIFELGMMHLGAIGNQATITFGVKPNNNNMR
jgi:hypothetical protein